MIIVGGKSQYTNLLILIKHESPKLYDLIGDLCLDGTFRSQRFENTFLMPNAELVKKISSLVNADKDTEAIEMIRSLFLKGHLKQTDFKKDAAIGTLQFGSYVLADPAEVGAQIADSGKTIIVTKTGAYATVVYNYKSDEAPKTKEGKSGGMTPVAKAGGSAMANEDITAIQKLTMKFIAHDNATTTMNNFFKAVTGALIILQNKDDALFKRAKYYLASNPILSWFFLTKSGHSGALGTAEDLKDFQWEAVTDLSIIEKAEERDYKLDKGLFKKIKSHRSQLINEKGDRSSLIKAINVSYNELIKEASKVGAVDEHLAARVPLKMLMDELRFQFDDAVKTWSQIDDAYDALRVVDWSHPSQCFVICNSELYEKSLIKGVEAFVSGPVTFVKSIYFMYAPLTEDVCEQLIKGMESKNGGSIMGGNPSAINNVVFTGGAARQQRKKAADVKLSALIKVLSKDQREALKKML